MREALWFERDVKLGLSDDAQCVKIGGPVGYFFLDRCGPCIMQTPTMNYSSTSFYNRFLLDRVDCQYNSEW